MTSNWHQYAPGRLPVAQAEFPQRGTAEDERLKCDETNPECRCPECVNAASDEADKG